MTMQQVEIQISALDAKRSTRFQHRWDGDALKAGADDLQILALNKLSIDITMTAQGNYDWRLSGRVGASLVQSCVLTLNEVKERLDVPVDRLYLHNFKDYESQNRSETKLDADVDPLPQVLNLFDLALEVVALNLTPFPKHSDAHKHPNSVSLAQPSKGENPFAVLKALKDKLQGDAS